MTGAARCFIDHLGRGAITPEDAQAFESLVFEAALARFGERDALSRLGHAKSVEGGNQGKLKRRHAERLRTLREHLG